MGCADRSAYDLSQHTQATGVRLAAEKKLAEPRVEDVVEAFPNKGVIGKAFKKDAKVIMEHLAALSEQEVKVMEKRLEKTGCVKRIFCFLASFSNVLSGKNLYSGDRLKKFLIERWFLHHAL